MNNMNIQETKGTVTISVEEYNVMRDFNEAIKAKQTIVVNFGWGFNYNVVSADEAIKQMGNTIAELNVKGEKNRRNSYILDTLKEMNWFEFRKWKKNYKNL
jgi:hypothetical protein|tara:strand:+ start:224 stop:526 length:303 start_codon:yes stop_codon:yes gene_type:complete